MNDVWQQFDQLKLDRESTRIKKRLMRMLIAQSVFITVFLLLQGVHYGTQLTFDTRMVHGLAFLFPVLGIMMGTSILIANFATYTGVYREFAWVKKNTAKGNTDNSVDKENRAAFRSLILTTGIALFITLAWIAILSSMTCAYQLPNDFIVKMNVI